MPSSVDIANSALTKLGEVRIMALTDNVKPAREMSAIFDLRRDKLLRTYNWGFAMKRASLPALAAAPSWGYAYAYQKPSDFLRLLQIEDDWTFEDDPSYRFEGQTIVTDYSAPLNIRYIRRVTNSGEFDASFCEVFAYDLAHEACEAITQSTSKKDGLYARRKQEILEAIRSNAIELPPQKMPEDEWLVARR